MIGYWRARERKRERERQKHREREFNYCKRKQGDKRWLDESLKDWDENDYRIWVGNLGNEVTDHHLEVVFNKYPSFLKAKVIREKMTGKSKGFGFVSFKDP